MHIEHSAVDRISVQYIRNRMYVLVMTVVQLWIQVGHITIPNRHPGIMNMSVFLKQGERGDREYNPMIPIP